MKLMSSQNLKTPIFRHFPLLFVSLLGAAFIGCGTDTIKDHITRELDRQRENNLTFAENYQDLEGDFETAAWSETEAQTQATASGAKGEPCPIRAASSVQWINDDANNIPSATLFVEFNLLCADAIRGDFKDLSGNPMPRISKLFRVSNGRFDPSLKIFSGTIPGNDTAGINISCKVPDIDTLICDWIPSQGSADWFRFTLHRKLATSVAK